MKTRLALIAGFSALLPLSGYLALYFVLNSSSARTVVQRLIDSGIRRGAIVFRGHQWGPAPDKLRVFGVTISHADGEKVIDAPIAQTRVDLRKLWHGRFHLRRITIKNFFLLLEWTRAGFHFVDAFKSGRPPSKVKKKSTIDLDFREIDLQNGRVELKFPSWRIAFHGVHISGEFSLGNGLHILARIHKAGGEAQLTQLVRVVKPGNLGTLRLIGVGPGRRVALPFSGLTLKRFLWRRDGFRVDDLGLAVDRSRLQISGAMDFDHKLSFDYRLSGQLKGKHHLAHILTGGAIDGDLDLRLKLAARLPSPLSLSNLIKLALTENRSPLEFSLDHLSGKRVSILGVPLSGLKLSLSSRLKLSALDSRLLLEKVVLDSREAALTANASFQLGPRLFGKNTYRISAHVGKLLLKQVISRLRRWPWLHELQPLAGVLSGEVELAGELRNVLIPDAPKRIDADLTVVQPTRTLRIRRWSNHQPRAEKLSIDWTNGWIRWRSYQAALEVVKR